MKSLFEQPKLDRLEMKKEQSELMKGSEMDSKLEMSLFSSYTQIKNATFNF